MSKRHTTLNPPSYQTPPDRVVVYWDERQPDGWWPGLPRHCAHCGGLLDAAPPNMPTYGPGRVYCLSCAREVADVRQRRLLWPSRAICPCGAWIAYAEETRWCRECDRSRRAGRAS